MENLDSLPVEPQEPQPKDIIVDDADVFEFRQAKLPDNPFLSRGCCQPPKIYNKNESVFQHRCSKFDSYDWLKKIPVSQGMIPANVIEVRFKNNRKDYFRTPPDLEVIVGDIVAVEASPGHDIGIVSMVGEMVRFQLHRKQLSADSNDIKKVYRKARQTDIEKWIGSVEMEVSTMYRAREIADSLALLMKINDVEIQGDNTKAIFYYTAEDRVDFRELIKLMAEEFKLRIEMRQIGARQEASRLGGIGSCGRELCCATWMSDFKSVTTNAARVQQLSLNPQKLAGQCGKLKCCLNYEYDTYVDALKGFPNTEIRLKLKRGEAFHQKTDIFQKTLWYSYVDDPGNFMALPIEMVRFIIEENKKGNLPEKLEDFTNKVEKKNTFESGVVLDDLTRFDNL
ncbi:MAG: regulatory iron-sulfur-containing complex subunit RicT [Bacteroidales bacterium]|nr:regulatory iron-sulfur-containing complex subunit RicT [Bacteroidales bacterium]